MISPTSPIRSHNNPLANGVRETMLQQGYGKGLLIAEALYHLKIKPETWLPFSSIHRLLADNFGTSYQMVYRGLQHRLIFQRKKAPGKANRRGARPYLYRLPHPEELQAEFASHVQSTPTDPLKKDDFKNLTAYRMGLHREMVVRRWCGNGGKGFMMCRGLMADRLGVSARTIRTYDKKLGHSSEPNYNETRIHWHNWDQLPRYKERYSPTGERLSSKQWLKVIDWNQGGQEATYPAVKYLAYQALNKGQSVFKVERLPNTYFPYQKPDVSQFEAQDAASHYMAEKQAQNAVGLFQDTQGQWYYRRE